MSRKLKLDWMKEIEITDLLENDTKLIASRLGVEALIKMWEYLPSFNLYISTKPITKAKIRYIEKRYDGQNAKELASELNISERTIYRLLQGKPKRGRPRKKVRGKSA